MTTHPQPQREGRMSHQRGVSLVMSLFFLLVVTMLALGSARVASDAVRGARAQRDRQTAFAAAEAGLADAERDITGGADPGSLRAAMFHHDGAIGFEPGCGRGPANLGLCAFSPGNIPAWQKVDAGASIPYGTFTGAVLSTGGPLPLVPPRYVIERLPLVHAGEDAGAGVIRQALFRITAFGYGARAGTLVVLQSVFRNPAEPVAGSGSGSGSGSGPGPGSGGAP